MKKLSIHYVVIGILLSCLVGCVNEDDVGGISDRDELEQFFSYHSKGSSASREGSCNLSDKGISCVINTLCTREDILRFVRMFKVDYGQPLWDNSVFIPCADRYVLYVPVVNTAISQEIQTIWTFHIKGDTLSHYPFTRNPATQYVEEYWKYDYFTTYALGIEPSSGLKFYNYSRSTTPPPPEVECIHAYVEIGGEIYDKGVHCWWNKDGGRGDNGELPPDGNFPDQPIPPGENPGGGGATPVDPNGTSDPVVSKITSNVSTLTERQIQKLKEAIEVMEDICMVDALMGEMRRLGKEISKVNIDTKMSVEGADACYNPGSNTLSFAGEEQITPKSLLHEYFHFYQTQKNNGNVAGKNGVLEIERNIYYDIVFACLFKQSGGTDYSVWTYQPDNMLNTCMNQSDPGNSQKYEKWLSAIYSELKAGNTVTITKEDLEYWGKLFKEHTTNSIYQGYDFMVGSYTIAINDALRLGVKGVQNCVK